MRVWAPTAAGCMWWQRKVPFAILLHVLVRWCRAAVCCNCLNVLLSGGGSMSCVPQTTTPCACTQPEANTLDAELRLTIPCAYLNAADAMCSRPCFTLLVLVAHDMISATATSLLHGSCGIYLRTSGWTRTQRRSVLHACLLIDGPCLATADNDCFHRCAYCCCHCHTCTLVFPVCKRLLAG